MDDNANLGERISSPSNGEAIKRIGRRRARELSIKQLDLVIRELTCNTPLQYFHQGTE